MSFTDEYNKLKAIIDAWKDESEDVYVGTLALFNKLKLPVVLIDYNYILNESITNKYPIEDRYQWGISYYADANKWEDTNERLCDLLNGFQSSSLNVVNVNKTDVLVNNRPAIGWELEIR